MKKIILSFLTITAVLFTSCMSTKLTMENNYSEVVEISGIQAELYTKANLNFVDMFKSSKSVVQYSDKESGVIKGKYFSPNIMIGWNSCDIYSIIQVDVKDNKYKISFSIASVEVPNMWNGKKEESNIISDDMLIAMKSKWKALATDFKSKMVIKNSDW